MSGDGAGHADRCTVLGLAGVRGDRRCGRRGRAARAACPGCGRFSDRVHDRYQRRLKDLPCSGPRAARRRPGAIPADAGSRASPSSSTGAAYR
ncbi:transposase family protein [Streptomyces sp. NPDC056653]|uniref:transposase family protein n=1 Tax=Streptomyces sp. NPDC056653 TaxID=3345894 RepID=UPI0036B2EC27